VTEQEQQTRIEQLERVVEDLRRRLGLDREERKAWHESDDPRERPDYVEHGSDEHAAVLGLQKAEEDYRDGPKLNGWRLIDPWMFGHDRRYQRYVLAQKVNELSTPFPELQSVSRRDPFFAPTMWMPEEGPFSKETVE
jgi:hypothetical protein